MHTTTLPTPLSHALGAAEHHTEAPTSYARGEQALWTAVITQALMDAASNSSKSEAHKNKHRARDWLATLDDDFQNVCDLAGLDPSYVATRAEKAISSGCKWRLPAGEGWRTKSGKRNQNVTEGL
ncbi:MAG: hypothetical protein C0436_02310 [Alphaproteobacteria bacterium]|nr:hypothetical protein [Alphaproteobacteria bacterium]